MKTRILYISSLMAVSLFAASCKKDITERNQVFEALAPANPDSTAGAWTPILTGSSTFTLALPDAKGTPNYTADLNEIKSYQKNLTSEQKDIIKYWSAGSVLRWNEILRELVAKHNLPPYQNDDGTYPFPSAANPLAYPLFPFSNPPYAARAYAYVSAAQYDALVQTFKFKYTSGYRREAPYANDANVQALVPKSKLPSYPSEDAAVAGATAQMMILLFPGDLDYIQKKVAEEKLYRLMAGANTRSDWDAGENLGKQVANVFLARARADKANLAAGAKDDWTKLETDAKAAGNTPWISLELPHRPPMLPLFPKVTPILMPAADVVAIRPAAPFKEGSAEYQKDMDEVMAMSKNYDRDHERIVAFWADGVGTATPPGHWNSIAAEEFVKHNWSEVRWARNMALLNMAEMDAAIVCWDTKYFYFNPRPTQMVAGIKTLTGIPNFPSYISGHATFSGAAATVLGYLVPERATEFMTMANEAGMSRLYGAIHYRNDCTVGLATGVKVGTYAVNRAKTDGAN
ncbi:phosphatase PAP2 family protein [Mucilaginibacter psychrotolerans]|uniref:Phosphatase PAP2 family protein n=1 Tax=Mucilaginibacter psychrotolerans TaxID=1524096 RepID=A0A4Y8S8T0_9SPHI|nr:phosphatase PAP2 family protein [Mucilaginibacter psychrotolerans]TFF34927.1 phosphatase PAP2 family protein [Mucilaginibacter psychrotolerans]